MGLADRDYTRSTRFAGARGAPRGGGWLSRTPIGGLGRLSANSILIILCCVVFLLDGWLPKTPVQLSQWRVTQGQEQAWEDLQRAHGAVRMIALSPNPQGIGRWFVWPGSLPPELALNVDPIAEADYLMVSPLRAWLQFTTAQAIVSFAPDGTMQGLQFWRFIGYGFLHVGLSHIIFNMIGLWVFGGIVEERFGRRRYFAIFAVSVVAGALLFLLLNAFGVALGSGGGMNIPGLLSSDPYTPLVGASAGVYGIILAAAWLAPDEEVLLFFILPMKIRTLALLLLGIAVFALLTSGRNAGGEAAHLGGAIAGWWVARRPHLLDDFFDLFGRRVSPRSSRPLPVDEREIDRILDKVRNKGLASLSERERETLRAASSGGPNGRGVHGRD
ncbi:MAG: Rhomboid protease GluP [Planctomycetota bacterium]|jgi:membrane associated rhomboid family serine protease